MHAPLTGLIVLGCVEEEPEYRLDDIECALRYNSLDSGVPAEYDEDEVANSINTTLNRSESFIFQQLTRKILYLAFCVNKFYFMTDISILVHCLFSKADFGLMY